MEMTRCPVKPLTGGEGQGTSVQAKEVKTGGERGRRCSKGAAECSELGSVACQTLPERTG